MSTEKHAHEPTPKPAPIGTDPVEGDGADALDKARQDLVRGLLYVHGRLNLNTGEALEALSLVTALVEMLDAKGLITPEDLDEAKRAAMQQLAGDFGAKEMGTLLQTAIEDKYDFKEEVTIDCASLTIVRTMLARQEVASLSIVA